MENQAILKGNVMQLFLLTNKMYSNFCTFLLLCLEFRDELFTEN